MNIWEVETSDGIRQYFDSKTEADFAAKDATSCGFGATTREIPVPSAAKEFAAFMTRQFERSRKLILAAHELAA